MAHPGIGSALLSAAPPPLPIDPIAELALQAAQHLRAQAANNRRYIEATPATLRHLPELGRRTALAEQHEHWAQAIEALAGRRA